MLYNQLANSGRFGDTQVREVNGELSHVNDIEACLIDNYGPLGESITMAIGSGTTNPTTGMKEYWFPGVGPVISTLLQVSGPLYDAYKNKDNNDLENNMTDWRENTEQLKDHANALMNRDSQFHQDSRRVLEQQGADYLAQQNMLTNRNMAQGGVGGYTGIRGAQNEANLSRMNANIMDNINENYIKHYTQGLGMLQDVGQDYKQFGEMQMNRDIANMTPGIGDIVGQVGGGLFNVLNQGQGGGQLQALIEALKNQGIELDL